MITGKCIFFLPPHMYSMYSILGLLFIKEKLDDGAGVRECTPENSVLINFNFITREVLSNPACLPNSVLEPESESLVSGLRPPVPGQCLRPHRSPRSQASNLRCVRLSGAGAGGSLSVKYHRHFHTITVPLRSKESYQRHLYKCL